MPRSIYRHCQCAALFILMCLFFCPENDRDGIRIWQNARARKTDPLKSIRFPIRRQLFLGEMEVCFELPSPTEFSIDGFWCDQTGMLKADYHMSEFPKEFIGWYDLYSVDKSRTKADTERWRPHKCCFHNSCANL